MFEPLGGNRDRPLRKPRRVALVAAAVAGAALLAACGGDRQDADAEAGEFPVDVRTVELEAIERTAEATELVVEVENVGDETLPDLNVSLFVDAEASDAFSIRVDDPSLADQNRPVWILEETYPRAIGITQEELTATPFSHARERIPIGGSGATTAEGNTFAFGPLEPGELIEMVWLITPVRPGGYLLNYEIAAGLQGPAEAVAEGGLPVTGELPVRISNRPKKERVNGQGEVVDG